MELIPLNININNKLLAHNSYFVQFIALLWHTRAHDLLFVPDNSIVAIKLKPINCNIATLLSIDYTQLQLRKGIIDYIPINEYKTLIFQIQLATAMNIIDYKPQSKSLTVFINHEQYNLRLSLHPTTTYYSLSIRIIHPVNLRQKQSFPILKPGLNLILGVTCSGKTTFLYNFLENLSLKNYTIVTIEDPVERIIPSIMQTSLQDNDSYDVYIKSALRQNPDVIVIGEIRDSVSAQGAMRAALSGHIVLATMHSKIVDDHSMMKRLCLLRLEDLQVPICYTEQLLETIIACDYNKESDFSYRVIEINNK